MEDNEFYCYPGVYMCCGACGSSMAPYIPNLNVRLVAPGKIYCGNQSCPKYNIVYLISPEHRVTVFDTGLRVVPPVQTGVIGYAGVGGPAMMTANAGNTAQRTRLPTIDELLNETNTTETQP